MRSTDGQRGRYARSSVRRALLAAVFVGFAACSTGPRGDHDAVAASPYPKSWIKEQIASYEAGTVRERSAVAGKYFAEGTPLYLIRSPCCDQFDYLYTAEGRIVCAPSGGFAGRGDGKCPGDLGPASPASRARSE